MIVPLRRAACRLGRAPVLIRAFALGFQHAQVARLFRFEALAVSLLAVPFAAPIAWAVARISMSDSGEFLPGGVALRAGPLAAALVGLVAVTLAACTPALRDLRRATLADEVRTQA